MEILCPNCQRKLTILEQYAGQQMKCPMCAGAFTAPALPAAPGIPPAPSATPVSPPAPLSPAGPQPAQALAPVSAPPAAPSPAAPEPSAPQPPPEPVPTEHTGRISIWISPRYTQFVPVALLFLVLVLTAFFTWVAYAPGGITLDSQNAWQATFGSWSTDSDLKDESPFKAGADFKAEDPGFGVLMLFWLLFFFFTFFLVIAVVALSFTHRFLPPKVQPYLRWRWALAALVSLLGFFVFFLQDAIGFNFERSIYAAINKKSSDALEDARKTVPADQLPHRTKLINMARGLHEQAVVRTFWYHCVWWFYFGAVIFLFITMLADLRSPRPSPRIDLLI
jgi:hypothetical protein